MKTVTVFTISIEHPPTPDPNDLTLSWVRGLCRVNGWPVEEKEYRISEDLGPKQKQCLKMGDKNADRSSL